MSESITRDEWLSAFQEALTAASQDDGALTTLEIAKALGKHDPRRVRLMLKEWLANGSAEHVMVRRTQINGITRWVPGYRLKKPVVQ